MFSAFAQRQVGHRDSDESVFAGGNAGSSQVVDVPNAPNFNQRGSEAGAGLSDTAVHDGMRREWNFTLQYIHVAARVKLLVTPQWEPQFIDQDENRHLQQLDHDATHPPLTLILRYTDFSAVKKLGAVGEGGSNTGSVAQQGSINPPNGEGDADDADPTSGEWWVEKVKTVRLLYLHAPAGMTLARLCTICVQHIIKDPHVVSVDDDTALSKLRIGNKLDCSYRLGGHRSFHFRYRVNNKSELVNDWCYAIGTLVNQRGYVFLVQCPDPDELEGYLSKIFLPYVTNTVSTKLTLDANVKYGEVTSEFVLEQQEREGELRYDDRDAAISFSMPMHPMRIRPDFSPAKTVGVGSIACMTLEIDVYEKLIDDAVVAEITGMPKYKVSAVVLCLDVEDAARMDYPSVMTTEQYSELKTKRLLDVFPDAKVVGLPTTLRIGKRPARSRTVSFAYEPLGTVAKAMLVSTLVGNFGVTALYLTKLGGGVFDTHLYLYEQLLNAVSYHQQNTAQTANFSRFQVANIRLLEQDLYRSYAESADKEIMSKHLKALREANDGKVDGAIEVILPPEEGGLSRHQQGPRRSIEPGAGLGLSPARASFVGDPEGAGAGGGGGLSRRGTMTRQSVFATRSFRSFRSFRSIRSFRSFRNRGNSVVSNTAPMGERQSVMLEGVSLVDGDSGSDDDDVSLHSQSLISITSVSRLQLMADTEELGDTYYNQQHRKAFDDDAAGGSPAGSFSDPSQGSNRTGSHSPSRRVSLQNQAQTGLEVLRAVEQEAPQAKTSAELAVEAAARVTSQGVPAEVALALKGTNEDLYFGSSLKDIYTFCCDDNDCRPNSYMLRYLPDNPRFTNNITEIDVSSNYLGHNGFAAVLDLLEHLPRIEVLRFANMSLDNTDADRLCAVLVNSRTVRSVDLTGNPKITLVATKCFTRLLKVNYIIKELKLTGTRLGDSVIAKLEREATAERNPEVLAAAAQKEALSPFEPRKPSGPRTNNGGRKKDSILPALR